MRMVRLYLGVFVVCLCLGLAFVALTPGPVNASTCGQCWTYSDCFGACDPGKYPNQSHYGATFSGEEDIECNGPWGCRFEAWGCHFCGQ
jgi:hypothetical protein